jgi:hypothetical protein
MAIQISSYPSPYSATPLINAYGWITGLSLNLAEGIGSVTLAVNPSQADDGKPPIASITVRLGQVLVAGDPGDPNATPPVAPTPAVTFPTLEQMLADPTFLAAWVTIATALYTGLLADPQLAGSTVLALSVG